MSFLDRSLWEGKIYSGGWTAGSGGEYDVVEPATGRALGKIGAATPADVAKAAERADRAQQEWAALTYDARAAVLRRAAQLFTEHEEEIHDWLIRESGTTRPFAGRACQAFNGALRVVCVVAERTKDGQSPGCLWAASARKLGRRHA